MRPQWLDEQLYPFNSRLVEIDDNRIHYVEMRAYRGPFPTRASRLPTAIFPREILPSQEYLAQDYL